VREQRDRGVRAESLVGRLARTLGLVDREESLTARELVSGFSLDRIAKHAVTMGD
jgi:hypothetical protein